MTPIDPAQGKQAFPMIHYKNLGLNYGDATMHIPHELHDEFPGEALFIERLIKSNYEFGQLATHYDELNRQIYRIESEEEPTADEVLERLKKQRLKLKDDIAALLVKLERRM